MAEARLLPVIKGTADVILSLSGKSTDKPKETATVESKEPEKLSHPVTTKTGEKKQTKRDTKPKPVPKSERTEANNEGGGTKPVGYDERSRRSLDQLVSSQTKPE
jgi:hypothetical protein